MTTQNDNQMAEASVRNQTMADLEHQQLANIINRMSDHLETVLGQRDELLAACREAHAALFALEGQVIEFPLAKRLGKTAVQLSTAIAAAEGQAQ